MDDTLCIGFPEVLGLVLIESLAAVEVYNVLQRHQYPKDGDQNSLILPALGNVLAAFGSITFHQLAMKLELLTY